MTSLDRLENKNFFEIRQTNIFYLSINLGCLTNDTIFW